jgi:hypothetical protein
VGVAGVTMALTPLLNHLFIRVAGWGFLGAAGTLLVHHCVELLLLLTAAAWHNARCGTQIQEVDGWGCCCALQLHIIRLVCSAVTGLVTILIQTMLSRCLRSPHIRSSDLASHTPTCTSVLSAKNRTH